MQTNTVATTDFDNVDWRVAGTNLAEENYRMGGQFGDARRLMLDAWHGWVSGDPDIAEILHEMRATLAAMTEIAQAEAGKDIGDLIAVSWSGA